MKLIQFVKKFILYMMPLNGLLGFQIAERFKNNLNLLLKKIKQYFFKLLNYQKINTKKVLFKHLFII